MFFVGRIIMMELIIIVCFCVKISFFIHIILSPFCGLGLSFCAVVWIYSVVVVVSPQTLLSVGSGLVIHSCLPSLSK